MAPWTEQSPLAAALGAATGYFQGKKEKEQLAYDRGEQAKKDAYLAAQTAALIAANKPLQMPNAGIWATQPGATPGAPPAAPGGSVAGPSPTGGVSTSPSTPAAPGAKTLGTVTAHATRSSAYPGEQDLKTKEVSYNALLPFVADPRYHDAIATMRQAYQDALSAKESWISDQLAVLKNQEDQTQKLAERQHWSAQDKDAAKRLAETRRHDLQTELDSVGNNIRSTSTSLAVGAAHDTQAGLDTRARETGSNQRQATAINSTIKQTLVTAHGAPVATGKAKNGKPVTKYTDGTIFYDDGTPYTP